MAATQHRPVALMPSAREVISSRSFASPLAQLSLASSSLASTSSLSSSRPSRDSNTVPPLDLDLFRTPSVYSIDSLASLSTISADERAFHLDEPAEDPESPTTPRAERGGDGYFPPLGAPYVSPTKTSRGSPDSEKQSTSKKSFVVTSRTTPPSESPPSRPAQQSVHTLQPQPRAIHGRGEKQDLHIAHDVESQHPEAIRTTFDLLSIHGEQGTDWGEDESAFEWVDTNGAPEATNGDGKDHHLSPTKRLGKLKAAVGGEGKKLKKQLVFARRAPPPPPVASSSGSSPTTLQPRPERFLTVSPRPPLTSRWTDGARTPSPDDVFLTTSHPTHRPPPVALLAPIMVPLRAEDGPTSMAMGKGSSRISQMSFQSAAYSFYDLDSPGPSTPRTMTPREPSPVGGESVFPRGTYTKVSISQLEQENDMRDRTMSERTPRRESPDTFLTSGMEGGGAEALVDKGIEARGKGDIARSAWCFMKAAEAGSATGRMYWGLALRHGWGVARDDRRAFAELRQACDESFVDGRTNFHQSPGAIKLTVQQKKAMARDLSLGLFEIANCFLEGVGVKKAPDIAVAYLKFAGNLGDLASQEQLGFLLSKGGNGIKKDMKEAARWYRMAIGQGSTNTFGLAWVWKDKYMS